MNERCHLSPSHPSSLYSLLRKLITHTHTHTHTVLPLLRRLVLAHDDPGPEYNWLDSEGRETGIIFYRFMLNTAKLTQTTSKVVKFASL